jgi:hypothetical protein
MAGRNPAVFGLYRTRSSVENALDTLRQEGCRTTDVMGPITAALAGAGVGGVVGGIAGALIGMGIPEYETKRYEGRIKEGEILLSVRCDNLDSVQKAKHILERTGAEDIGSAGEAAADFEKSERPTRRGQAV